MRGLNTGLGFLLVLFSLPLFVSADFTPSSLGNLQLWIDASVGATTDGTTPASEGDTVQQWNDQSGNSNNAIQNTAGDRPIYRASVQNGLPGLEFITSGKKLVTPSFLDSTYDTAYSIYAVVKHTSTSLKVFAGNGSGKYYGAGSNNTIIENTSDLTSVATNVTEPAGSVYIASLRYDGSTKNLAGFGATTQFANSVSATGNLGLSGALTIGDFDGGGFTWDGQILALILYKRALTTNEDRQVTDYLRTRYALNSTTKPQIFFDGNSLTAGTGASDSAHYYPSQTLALLGGASVYDITNIAAGGQTTAQRATADTTSLDPKYGSFRSNNIAVLWEVTNDLVINQDAANAYAQYVAWCQGRRTAGFKVVAMTVLPRTQSGLYAGFETDRQTINTLIRANWQTFSDALADVAGDSNIGDAGDQLNTTYYNADSIHMNDAGYAIIASYVANQINILTDTTAPTVSVTAPTNTATVSGNSVSLTANAADSGSGIAGVQFKLDTNIGAEDTTSTYGVTWDSTAVEDGSHTIIAVARDMAGNYATSSAVDVVVDNTSSVLSDGLPFGEQASGTTELSLSLSTDEDALCKYGIVPDIAYDSIASSFSATSTTHSVGLSSLMNGTNYTYYIRCQDDAGNTTLSDYTISFSILATPEAEDDDEGTQYTGNKRHVFSGQPSTSSTATTQSVGPQDILVQLRLLLKEFVALGGVLSPSMLPYVEEEVTIYFRDLVFGDVGSDVWALQQFLIEKNTGPAAGALNKNGASGYFGPLTQDALAEFQKSVGITPALGIFGPITRALLNQ